MPSLLASLLVATWACACALLPSPPSLPPPPPRPLPPAATAWASTSARPCISRSKSHRVLYTCDEARTCTTPLHHGVVCTCGETHRAEARAHDDGRCAARERLHDRLGRGHVRRRVEAHDARRVVRRHTEAQRGGAAAELARVRPDGLSDGALRLMLYAYDTVKREAYFRQRVCASR